GDDRNYLRCSTVCRTLACSWFCSVSPTRPRFASGSSGGWNSCRESGLSSQLVLEHTWSISPHRCGGERCVAVLHFYYSATQARNDRQCPDLADWLPRWSRLGPLGNGLALGTHCPASRADMC